VDTEVGREADEPQDVHSQGEAGAEAFELELARHEWPITNHDAGAESDCVGPRAKPTSRAGTPAADNSFDNSWGSTEQTPADIHGRFPFE
jgi:hypothetical protein